MGVWYRKLSVNRVSPNSEPQRGEDWFFPILLTTGSPMPAMFNIFQWLLCGFYKGYGSIVVIFSEVQHHRKIHDFRKPINPVWQIERSMF